MLTVDMHLYAVVRKRLISLCPSIYRRRRRRLWPNDVLGVVSYIVFRIQVIVNKLLKRIVKRSKIYVLAAYVLYTACVIVWKSVVPTILKNYVFLRYVVHFTSTTFRLSCSDTYSTLARP
jgi:hypothetical protein